MVQTTKTLHVCPYYPEHKITARKLYGTDRVNEQLKKHITYCNECSMFPDLLIYLDIINDDLALVETENKLELDYWKEHVKDYKEKRSIGVNVNLVYNEVLLPVDEFFNPPKDGKRWIDHL